MWLLLKQNLLHVLRARFLLVLLVFSFAVEFVGLRAISYLTVRFQGVISIIDNKNALFAALFLQLFTGAFVAIAYGIWMVPYAHRGSRSTLTFVLPVSRWLFPCAYAVSMFFLLGLQNAVMLVSYGLNFGIESVAASDFPWRELGMSLLLQTLAFETLMFAFAVGSLLLGQVPTFFLGAILIFLLQVSGALFRVDIDGVLEQTSASLQTAKALYALLPPVGELFFDLRKMFLKPSWDKGHLSLWFVWLLVLAAGLRVLIGYPRRSQASES